MWILDFGKWDLAEVNIFYYFTLNFTQNNREMESTSNNKTISEVHARNVFWLKTKISNQIYAKHSELIVRETLNRDDHIPL